MYGGTSYYWRGASTTNYLKFGGYCWRIVRINGDGTIRLIYDGTTCHANGTSTNDSIAVENVVYNSSYNKSEYVGWKYTEGSQRPSNTSSGTDAPIKTTLENWYNSNLASHANKISDGKYCNDRKVAANVTWSSTPNSILYYMGQERLERYKTPSLNCNDINDVYNLKVGLIMADEIAFAGGKYDSENSNYYLYNGKSYWTMSPYHWASVSRYTGVFRTAENGKLIYIGVHGTTGVRPVINLKADIQISGGNGTLENPYIVAD